MTDRYKPVRLASRRSVVIVIALLLTGACTDKSDLGNDRSADTEMTPTEQLLARPTAEDAVATYQNQLVQVRQSLARLAPEVEWGTEAPRSSGDSGCGEPWGGLQGSTSDSFLVFGSGAIPDKDWPRAVSVVGEILEADGYDKAQVTVDKPGLHSVSFYGPYGAELIIAGKLNTTIQLTGGCFFDAKTHGKGKPNRTGSS